MTDIHARAARELMAYDPSSPLAWPDDLKSPGVAWLEDVASAMHSSVGVKSAAVRRAADAVHATPFIERLPQQFATPVVERGATLSVGQKQLLSLARALAFDPPVLILDEATSSVDTDTERLIRDALHTVMHGRTTIAIAHRLSTIQDMNRILVLHKGELRESGTHQELLALRGLYHRLYQLQFGVPARAMSSESGDLPGDSEDLHGGSEDPPLPVGAR